MMQENADRDSRLTQFVWESFQRYSVMVLLLREFEDSEDPEQSCRKFVDGWRRNMLRQASEDVELCKSGMDADEQQLFEAFVGGEGLEGRLQELSGDIVGRLMQAVKQMEQKRNEEDEWYRS